MTNTFGLLVPAVLQQTVDCHPAVGSRNRWTLSGSWARQANKPASGHCWLMQNLPVVLPHSSNCAAALKTECMLMKCCLSHSYSTSCWCTIQTTVHVKWHLPSSTVLSCVFLAKSPCMWFPLWLWKCLFKVLRVYMCVCVWGFYVHDLIPQWAKNLLWWLCGHVCVCVRTRTHVCDCSVHTLFSLPHSFLVKADREHTKFI